MARDEDRNPELVCSCVAGGSQGVQIPKTYQDTRYTFHGFGDVNHEPVLELWEAENSILAEKELVPCAGCCQLQYHRQYFMDPMAVKND